VLNVFSLIGRLFGAGRRTDRTDRPLLAALMACVALRTKDETKAGRAERLYYAAMNPATIPTLAAQVGSAPPTIERAAIEQPRLVSPVHPPDDPGAERAA
jgi:hypothetical protein